MRRYFQSDSGTTGSARRQQGKDVDTGPSNITALLESLSAAGPWCIGQIHVSRDFELRHVHDIGRQDLIIFNSPQAARQLALYDDAGKFRPLKSAPNLRHGWQLKLSAAGDLRLALDLFYPGAIGTWLAWLRGEIEPVPLRMTLKRQTGMYRVVDRISDDQADDLVRKTCSNATGCLRRILWPISAERTAALTVRQTDLAYPNEGMTTIPILCVEACNFLVAAGRPVAKSNPAVMRELL